MTKRNYTAESEARKRAQGAIKASVWIIPTPEAKAALKRLEKRYGIKEK